MIESGQIRQAKMTLTVWWLIFNLKSLWVTNKRESHYWTINSMQLTTCKKEVNNNKKIGGKRSKDWAKFWQRKAQHIFWNKWNLKRKEVEFRKRAEMSH